MHSGTPSAESATQRDGVPTCVVCARTAHDENWCPLIASLVCGTCCHRMRNLDPATYVAALSHADFALSPTEVARACGSCAGNSPLGREQVPVNDTAPS